MTRRVHHVVYCLKPEHLDSAVELWSEILGVEFTEHTANPSLRVFYSPDAGLELISPVPGAPDVPPRIAEFVEQYGEGIHTLVFEVPDIEGAEQRAVARGLSVENRLSFPTLDETDLSEVHGMRLTLAHIQSAPDGA